MNIKILFISIITLLIFVCCQKPQMKKISIDNSPPATIESLFFEFPVQKKFDNPAWGKVLLDIKQHETFYENNFNDLVTMAHEATHDVSIHLRMKWEKKFTVPINGFYCLENRAIILKNPPIQLSQVYAFIPENMRDYSYDFYFPSSEYGYEDNPLYIWEEWNCYLNGAQAGIDLADLDLWKGGGREMLLSLLEFQVYAAALAMAAKELSPEFYNSYKTFMKFFIWNSKRTFTIYQKARKIIFFESNKHEKYYQKIQNHPDAKKIKEFLQTTCEIVF